MSTGRPVAAARSTPAGSVSTAAAPACWAFAANSAPCVTAPGRAAYRSPGSTEREATVTPVTSTELVSPLFAGSCGEAACATLAISSRPTGTTCRGLIAATAPPAADGVDTGPEATAPGTVTPT